MGLIVGDDTFGVLWASDVAYDGLRLEIYDVGGEHWFEVSVPEVGPVTLNTFSREVPQEVIAAAFEMARREQ